MGQNFSSEPVVAKETERDHNDTFNVAVSSCQGWRMTQEDNHNMILELPGDRKAAFFAVYDGHGSARVSKHASERLWRYLAQNTSYNEGNFEEALREAFMNFDREVDDSYNAQLAGTTAVCLLIVDNMIYCANIGDSRGVACINCECFPLSYDHKPENPQELKRILAAGGYVLGNRVNGNLALSRAFGDFHYKGNIDLPPEQQIVSSVPDITSIELKDDVDFLLLACDGIWDVLSSEEVVEFVVSRLEQNMEPGLICEQLTTRCLATDYELVIGCDNMTVLLVCYTRGRSWVDFCTDIFNKNTKRLGVSRIKPTTEESALETLNQITKLEDNSETGSKNDDFADELKSDSEFNLNKETSVTERQENDKEAHIIVKEEEEKGKKEELKRQQEEFLTISANTGSSSKEGEDIAKDNVDVGDEKEKEKEENISTTPEVDGEENVTTTTVYHEEQDIATTKTTTCFDEQTEETLTLPSETSASTTAEELGSQSTIPLASQQDQTLKEENTV